MATGVQELKRTARMQEWSVRIAECRSSGMIGKRSTIHTSQGELFHEILCPKSSREVPRVLETKEGHKWQQVYRN